MRRRAIRLLARREYSRQELRRRLTIAPRRKTVDANDPGTDPVPPCDPQQLEQLLDELVAKDLQSDERFAQSLLRRRGSREGRALIGKKLNEHRIDPVISEPLLSRLADNEFERAYQVWLRRYGELSDSWPEKSRQARFLTSRGFASDIVRRILNGQTP